MRFDGLGESTRDESENAEDDGSTKIADDIESLLVEHLLLHVEDLF